MSFSFLRRWVNRLKAPNADFASNTSIPAGAEEQFLRGLHFAGQGVAQDYIQAAQCYSQAADQGHSQAQLNLATLYEHGQGVTQDEAKARTWLTRAANLGNAAAQYRLGVLQHLARRPGLAGTAGEGRIEALKWVRLSAMQGYRGAANACEFVALAMTLEEVAEGGRRVAAFLPTPQHPV